MTTSVLLERTDDLLQKLYQCMPDPDPTFLFDSTELQGCRQQSPIWLHAKSSAAVLDQMQNTPERWAGLILESQVPSAVLLAHLRHMLFVHFDGGRRGALRYWNPTTASYLFSADIGAASTRCLGPISHLCWHGGQWSRLAEDDLRWHYVTNPDACTGERSAEPRTVHLDALQEEALRRQQKEHFVYRWWSKQDDISFAEAARFLDEGMSQGFVDATALEEYLSIRALRPGAQAPGISTQGSNEDRLQLLRRSLPPNDQDKESWT